MLCVLFITLPFYINTNSLSVPVSPKWHFLVRFPCPHFTNSERVNILIHFVTAVKRSVSVLVHAGPVCEMDEMLLESAYQLLRIILETNAQTGKHMLLCESGEHILSLFEVLYPLRHYKTGQAF
jgi:hypothetical protein